MHILWSLLAPSRMYNLIFIRSSRRSRRQGSESLTRSIAEPQNTPPGHLQGKESTTNVWLQTDTEILLYTRSAPDLGDFEVQIWWFLNKSIVFWWSPRWPFGRLADWWHLGGLPDFGHFWWPRPFAESVGRAEMVWLCLSRWFLIAFRSKSSQNHWFWCIIRTPSENIPAAWQKSVYV